MDMKPESNHLLSLFNYCVREMLATSNNKKLCQIVYLLPLPQRLVDQETRTGMRATPSELKARQTVLHQ